MKFYAVVATSSDGRAIRYTMHARSIAAASVFVRHWAHVRVTVCKLRVVA